MGEGIKEGVMVREVWGQSFISELHNATGSE